MKKIIYLIYITIFAFGVSATASTLSYLKNSKFKNGVYEPVVQTEGCPAGEFKIKKARGAYHFLSLGMLSMLNIDKAKSQEVERQCRWNTTSKVVGKVIQWREVQTCKGQPKVQRAIDLWLSNGKFSFKSTVKVTGRQTMQRTCKYKYARR